MVPFCFLKTRFSDPHFIVFETYIWNLIIPLWRNKSNAFVWNKTLDQLTPFDDDSKCILMQNCTFRNLGHAAQSFLRNDNALLVWNKLSPRLNVWQNDSIRVNIIEWKAILLQQKYVIGCEGVVKLGGLILGFPGIVPLRWRLEVVYFSNLFNRHYQGNLVATLSHFK